MIKRLCIICTLILSIVSLLLTKSVFSQGSQIGDVFPEVIFADSPVTISMDFQDASLKDILKILSIQSGLNFIASQAVQDRKITLYLDNVPLKEAIDSIFEANNLSYDLDQDAKMILVKDWGAPIKETITKIYSLKHASVSASALKGELGTYLDLASEGAGVGNLTEVIKGLLSPAGKIIEEPRTNSLIVTDIPSKFSLIEAAIKHLDVPVPQIMLEVEMLDVSKDAIDKLGVKFGQTPFDLTVTGASTVTTFPLSWFGLHDTPVDHSSTAGSLGFGSYRIYLDFLKTQSDTRLLARPRVLTLNNITAEIKIVKDEIIGIKTSYNDQGGASSREPQRTSDVGLIEEGAGVLLRVTPQVNIETGEITMFLHPKISDVAASTLFPDDGADADIKSTKSVVRVSDGETIVIGGLITYDKKETITKLPILGDLPFIGKLFRHRNTTEDSEREVLVFITPHIIDKEYPHFAKINKNKTFEREQSSVSGSGLKRQRYINNFLNKIE